MVRNNNNNSSFFIMLFVLLIAFSLVTANVISSTTAPAVYAAKKGGSKSSSSGGSSGGGGKGSGGSGDKGGGSSDSGSGSKSSKSSGGSSDGGGSKNDGGGGTTEGGTTGGGTTEGVIPPPPSPPTGGETLLKTITPPPPPCDPSKETCDTKPPCKSGFHREGDTCVSDGCHKNNMTDCGDGGGGHGGGGSSSSTTKTVIKTTVIVSPIIETTVKNFIAYNIFTAPSQGRQPTFLLLLDTAQLCQIARDVQCVTQQNQFKTRNIVTKLDSVTGKSWIISGQAENVASSGKTLTSIRVVAHFYDSRGNNIGGLQQVAVTPGTLKALQSGVFNIKADTSRMSGIPVFVRLDFQSSA
jgi:hypothetical protein